MGILEYIASPACCTTLANGRPVRHTHTTFSAIGGLCWRGRPSRQAGRRRIAKLDRSWASKNTPMKYRYLETTGSLNEAASDRGWRERDSSPGLPAHRHAARKPPRWRGIPIPIAVCGLIPESLARENQVFPIAEDGDTLRVAAVDYDDVGLSDKISFILSRPVRLVAASPEEIGALCRDYFRRGIRSGNRGFDASRIHRRGGFSIRPPTPRRCALPHPWRPTPAEENPSPQQTPS